MKTIFLILTIVFCFAFLNAQEKDSIAIEETKATEVAVEEEEPTYHFYVESLVYNKNYTNTILFISRHFECKEPSRSLEDSWKEEFKNKVYESQKLWDFFKDVRKSKAKIVKSNSLGDHFRKYNQSKRNYNKAGSVRLVDFGIENCQEQEAKESIVKNDNEEVQAEEEVIEKEAN